MEKYDIIIIGAGPAGLTAAIYAGRAGKSCLVIEKEYMSGGQVLLTSEVENYPGFHGISGFELGEKLRSHAEKFGTEFVTDEVISIENAFEKQKTVCGIEKKYQTERIVLAMGARHKTLGVEGEEKLSGMGVSYCATCDGAFFKNKTVAVVGGGNVALEDAIYLSALCKEVLLIHRRDTFRGEMILRKRVEELPNVTMLLNSTVTKILGEDQVEEIEVASVPDGKKDRIQVDGVFLAVGIAPNTAIAEPIVEMDENRYILAGEDGRTSVEGIYAAGDLRKKQLRQIITATADGANVIQSILEDS